MRQLRGKAHDFADGLILKQVLRPDHHYPVRDRMRGELSIGHWRSPDCRGHSKRLRLRSGPPVLAGRLPHFATLIGLVPGFRYRDRSFRSLYCCSDGVRGLGAPGTNLVHHASSIPEKGSRQQIGGSGNYVGTTKQWRDMSD